MTRFYTDLLNYQKAVENVLSSPISSSYSTKHMQSYMHSRASSSTSRNFFVPFVNERDSTGKLLGTEESDSRAITLRKSTTSNEILTIKPKRNNVAFLSTLSPSSSRIKRKKFCSPSVGFYNPIPTDSIQYIKPSHSYSSNMKSHGSKIYHGRVKSLNEVNYDVSCKSLGKKVRTFSFAKQLARHDAHEESNLKSGTLDSPRIKLPEYLSKYKGMYHRSDLAHLELYRFPRRFMELSKRQEDLIREKITELRKMEAFLRKKSNWYK
jgi:hypothetical protein